MKRTYLIILYVFIALSILAQKQPGLYSRVDSSSMHHWVDSIYNQMTLDEKIGQLFMIVVDPNTKTSNTNLICKHIKSRHIGGILFSKGSFSNQAESTNKYQAEAKIPLLISLDGEWGLSMRLSNTTRFPRNMMLGAIVNHETLELYGAEVARQCREMGIHINFAPVLDVNSNPSNPVIGTRSFGENPERVSRSGIAYSKGLEKGKVMAVGKHFPGHGDTSEDSHHTTPSIFHDREQLEKEGLYPFREFVNAGFSGLMTGHLNVPALDSISKNPTSLSPVIVSGLLKDSLGFEGLTFTDALVMKGASSDENASVLALLAGNDVLLSPASIDTDYLAVKNAVNNNKIPESAIEERCKKILRYKYVLGLNAYRPIAIPKLESRLNNDSADWICRRLNAESMTLLKNTGDILPVRQLDKTRIASVSFGEKGITDFQHILKKYAKVDAYFLSSTTTAANLKNTLTKLATYDLIICGIHSPRNSETAALKQLLKENLVLCFFTSPYTMDAFKVPVDSANAVVMAYENTKYAQEYAAQMIMGGIPATGKLPVSVSGLFTEGAGITTEKVRLSYHHPLDVAMSSSQLSKISLIAKEGIKGEAYPGCQVLVAKNGVVIYEEAFGHFDYANTHEAQSTDMYDLASVTKVLATVPAVMSLYDQKKIKLSDHLSKYVSELQHTDKTNITVQDALFHESGLVSFLPFYQSTIDKKSYDGKFFAYKQDAIFRVLYDNNVYARTDFKFLPNLVSNVEKKGFNLQVATGFYLNNGFKKLALMDIANSTLSQKGKYRYSDLNFMLLKEAVENITKEPFDQYLDSCFYQRLGANHTMFQPLKHKVKLESIAPTENDRVIRNQLLVGHVHDEAAAFMGGVSGNAGLFSNANDLAKLLQLFLNEGAYGGETYYDKETSNLFTKTKSSISRRGLGFDKPDTKNKPDYLPASVFGHTGFTGTCVWADPDNQLIYIFLCNRIYPSRINKKLSELNIRTRIQEVIYDALK